MSAAYGRLALAAVALTLTTTAWAQTAAPPMATPRAGVVYEATPQPYVPPGASDAGTPGTVAAPAAMPDGAGATAGATDGAASAPVAPGAGVEIISGGSGGTNGAAKVGRMPVLQ